jgi:acyl dehydratase
VDPAPLEPRSLVARNTATASTNRIHDDEVARSFGFRGGLVPGVDVYAYLTQPPAAAWGRAWLEGGALEARFAQPVYDGDRVEVVPLGSRADGAVDLEVRDPTGAVCATAVATLGHGEPAPDPGDWPDVAQVADPPVAAPEHLVPGTALGLDGHGFHADRAGEYLDDVREASALYREEGLAHPGWVLRDANYVLSANVQLGPWIHVGSRVRHHDVVGDGDLVSARALVTAEWERKGHRFVTLDVLHLATGPGATAPRVVARTEHTAIYRPRGT